MHSSSSSSRVPIRRVQLVAPRDMGIFSIADRLEFQTEGRWNGNGKAANAKRWEFGFHPGNPALYFFECPRNPPLLGPAAKIGPSRLQGRSLREIRHRHKSVAGTLPGRVNPPFLGHRRAGKRDDRGVSPGNGQPEAERFPRSCDRPGGEGTAGGVGNPKQLESPGSVASSGLPHPVPDPPRDQNPFLRDPAGTIGVGNGPLPGRRGRFPVPARPGVRDGRPGNHGKRLGLPVPVRAADEGRPAVRR